MATVKQIDVAITQLRTLAEEYERDLQELAKVAREASEADKENKQLKDRADYLRFASSVAQEFLDSVETLIAPCQV